MNAIAIPTDKTRSRLLLIMLSGLALLPLTYLPPFNPFTKPQVDLTGPVALAAYWLSESGGVYGIPIVAVFMTMLVVCRAKLTWRQRGRESAVILLAVAGLLGVLASINEHVVKPIFAVPRPNIQELAAKPPDPPLLGMTVAEFYALPDKAARSDYLRTVLTPDRIDLPERIRAHWIAETGFSFPSGHSFAAMMFATFFLGLGLGCCTGRRLWPLYLLVVWAVAVCFARPILRVHSPTDVCLGGLEGVLAGVLALELVRRVLPELGANPAS